ncbi:hypothetical protein J5X98_17145 [Leptothermofonsia sichuanensis E412]|uniref:hypothetical protein n=1 Tax=Leptothermofonsia sichuanensis TaxID=2917832 RepID=UPI001CA7856A|nr:hypothetical protein [Leptothermofonsia sichuanensis]QZZ19130.1 hypothetical protein J5X98_17145 [Leptothermofonsia sichuanensis E412]
MQPAAEFLTPEECAEVDKALLTSHDKFATRVAIYALRSLKTIAQQQETVIEALTPEHIEDWVYQDESLQAGSDREFRKFFSRLVTSSLSLLKQIAQEADTNVAGLTPTQVITWFEQVAKQRMDQTFN